MSRYLLDVNVLIALIAPAHVQQEQGARVQTASGALGLPSLAPLTRMQAWGVPEIKVGESLALLGFAFTGERGDAVMRVEYLFVGGKTYGLRSSPA